MKTLCMLGLAASAMAASSAQDALRHFQDFKVTFNRQYVSAEEEQRRFGCFVKTLAAIDRLNTVDTATHVVNRFADLCSEEFKAWHSLKVTNSSAQPTRFFSAAEIKALPTDLDWRTMGAVTGVKDQQQCGSCWAFSTVAALEAAWKLAGHPLTSLSEEELVECSTNGNYGCQGGEMGQAVQWVIQNGGLNSEEAYPYTSGTGVAGTCDTVKSKVSVAKFSALIKAPQDEAQIAAYLNQYGPLFIAVDAMDGWQTYGGGIKTVCSGTDLDHGVALVGYGADYWIVRNSWGQSWGENGYIRLQRGVNCDGMIADVGTARV